MGEAVEITFHAAPTFLPWFYGGVWGGELAWLNLKTLSSMLISKLLRVWPISLHMCGAGSNKVWGGCAGMRCLPCSLRIS